MRKVHLAAALAALCIGAHAGHHEKADHATDKAMEPMAMSAEDMAMMEAMSAAAAVGDAHARLAKGVGQFNAAMNFRMGADAEPMASTMTVDRRMDLGGRVLVENWQGNVMGQPFNGVGRTGYDNVSKRYWSTWTDNMSTGVLVMYGKYDADSDTMEFRGENVHPATGKTYSMRSVGTWTKDGHETMAMYEDHGAGEYEAMTFTLTPR